MGVLLASWNELGSVPASCLFFKAVGEVLVLILAWRHLRVGIKFLAGGRDPGEKLALAIQTAGREDSGPPYLRREAGRGSPPGRRDGVGERDTAARLGKGGLSTEETSRAQPGPWAEGPGRPPQGGRGPVHGSRRPGGGELEPARRGGGATGQADGALRAKRPSYRTFPENKT